MPGLSEFVIAFLPNVRFDLGFGNPNKTGSLFCMLALSALGFANSSKRSFWIGLICFTAFGLGLICTQSRGACLGALVGIAVLIKNIYRQYSFPQCAALIGLCAFLVLFASATRFGSRLRESVPTTDGSIVNRLLIWKQVPQMLHDAPTGWGIGKSGEAFVQWYQPLDRFQNYRTLVSSHLTWIVELGIVGGILYLLSWTTILTILYPSTPYAWETMPFSIWVAWAICCCFSSVGESLALWVIPFGSLIIFIFKIKKNQISIMRVYKSIIVSLIISVAFLGILLMFSSNSLVHYKNGVTIIGSKSPTIWLISPDKEIIGAHFGHDLRKKFETPFGLKTNSVAVVDDPKDVPPFETVILSGKFSMKVKLNNPAEILIISPQPSSLSRFCSSYGRTPVVLIVGEFSAEKSFCIFISKTYPNVKLLIVKGCGDFIPGWVQEIEAVI